MYILCNGQQSNLPEETTLEQFLHGLQLPLDSVVIELNKTIIQPDQYAKIFLQEGDALELIQFVGGG